MFPLTIFIIVFANLFIYVWMGHGYENSILVVRLLVLGILVNTLTGVGVMIVRGIGKPIYETRYALISLILNIILSILLVRPLGFFGVVIATPVSAIIGSLYFIISFHHLYSIPLLGFVKKIYIKPFFFSTSLAAAIYYFNTVATKSTMIDTRVGFLTLLVIDAILFFVPFVFLLNKSQFWDVEDEVMLVEKARPYPIIHKIVSILV